ncbi:DNA repair protein XRCC4 [Aspergillus udagawae]|uniref:DNA repair protein XRCC4 n=1 Tax=Aspergillus udagawae TaxID=91492 RepID=A0A8H3S5D8_9EURO|nr:DNA repair protein XRCC4 [Aspergillus udagawae]
MPSSKLDLSQRILRISRSDDTQGYVLLQVSPTSSDALDLDIAATEGENPYTGTVRQTSLRSLCAKSYRGSDDEWVQIVSYVFGQLKESIPASEMLSGIESSASIIESGDVSKELVITIRKRVQSITQRLGSVTLRQDDEQAIQLFDWSGAAVARADALDERLSALTDRYRAAEDAIQRLNKQLEEFMSAKTQHDELLMANFVQLLNEKKLKIRNQQRLLASAKVDSEKASEIRSAIPGTHPVSGPSKWKTKRSAQDMLDGESDSEDGFERMEVDHAGQNDGRSDDQETEDEQTSTPQPLEDDENTDTGEALASPPIENEREGYKQPSSKTPQNSTILTNSAVPPPRRELPFVKKSQVNYLTSRSNESVATEEDAEATAGETDDDEL